MPHFEACFAHIIDVEKAVYTNRSADRGGPTKFGITQRSYSDFLGYHAEPSEVKNMTVEVAKIIYKTRYYDPMRLSELSFPIACVLFDIGVNRGPGTAARIMQRVVGAEVDGILGPESRGLIDASDEKQLIVKFLLWVIEDYVDIVRSDITQLANLKGWLNRAMHLIQLFVV